MSRITFEDIYVDGTKCSEDQRKVIYLTSNHPLQFSSNTWFYKVMPSMNQWLEDIKVQQRLHTQQGSNHLSFYFPENEPLTQQWIDFIQERGFELGLMELYVVEGEDLSKLPQNQQVEIQHVSEQNIEDYLKIYQYFAQPFGESYAIASAQHIRAYFENDIPQRLIAYINQQPVGIVDLIVSMKSIEIDGFGVLETYRHQGIGSKIQAYIGKLAKKKPVILVADGEDTAKDMYLKQGYTFLGYRYQILKENI